MSARTDLIADWQRRLATAEDAALDASNLGWLAAARVRLYRFLLSLYGDGRWNADACDDADAVAANETPTVVIDAEGAFPVHGKPAKGIGKIQAVLKSVANANGAIPAGPLVQGLDATSWVAAASGRAAFIFRCAIELRRYRIPHRRTFRGREAVIEVRSIDSRRAAEIVDRIRATEVAAQQESPSRRKGSTVSSLAGSILVVVLLTGPFLGAMCGYLVQARLAQLSGGTEETAFLLTVLTIWIGTATFAIAFAILPITRAWSCKFDRWRSGCKPRVASRRNNRNG